MIQPFSINKHNPIFRVHVIPGDLSKYNIMNVVYCEFLHIFFQNALIYNLHMIYLSLRNALYIFLKTFFPGQDLLLPMFVLLIHIFS